MSMLFHHSPGGLTLIFRKFAALSFMLELAVPGAAAAQSGLPRMLYSRGPVSPEASVGELLARHNVDRRQAGVPALAWDPALAQGAQTYANELARLNLLRDSPKVVRRGLGENLWMGTRNYFRPSHMVDAWASERSMFTSGAFPALSRTGSWADVGHYTQMIWPSTQRVGCAIAKSARADVLVCRYWPSGNVDGQRDPRTGPH